MKPILLLFIALFCCQSLTFAQKGKEPENQFKLIIKVHGLDKNAPSSYAEYEVLDFKLNYFYNYTGAMGSSDIDEHATKKIPSRGAQEIYGFIEKSKDLFINQEMELDGHGDDSEQAIELVLSYKINGEEEVSWSLKGGSKPIEVREEYKKVLEFETLIRNWVGLGAK